MKIEDVEGFLIADAYVVRIRTDTGLSGIGQTACWGYVEAVERIVAKFRQYLIGKNPLQIEHH
ncbi:MAG: galactokinase, partial [Chloroflexi bacterium]|nr:galactokinase [Chloroflexota bacterium]